MQAVTQIRPWRGWLFASVPLLLLYTPPVVGRLWMAHQEAVRFRETGVFILSSDCRTTPLITYLLNGLPFAVALVFAVLFYRWGAHQRPAVKRSLVLVALPWLLGTAHLLLLWRYSVLALMYLAGMEGVATLSAGLGELLTEQAVAAIHAALLLASLGVVLALDASGVGLRGAERPRDASWTRGAGLVATCVCVLSIVSIACAGFASRAGAEFFYQIAKTGLNEWPAEQDTWARRWAMLQAVQWGATLLALLGLAAGARHQRASSLSKAARMTPWLAGVLLAISSGAHWLVTRAVASDVARIAQVGHTEASSAALHSVDVLRSSKSFKPVLSTTSEGLFLSGRLAARWDAEDSHVDRALADYRRLQTIEIEGESQLPHSLAVGLERSATLRSVACLGAAARRAGVARLLLAVGPEDEVPAETRSALRQISPALGQAFSRRVSVLPLSLSECRDSGAEHVLTIDMGQEVVPVESELMKQSCRTHSHCAKLRVTPNSTLDDLLRFLGTEPGASVEFEPGLSQVCHSSALPL